MITLQWREKDTDPWQTLTVKEIAVARPVTIRIEPGCAPASKHIQPLVDALKALFLSQLGKITVEASTADPKDPEENGFLLEVLVCDGKTAVPLVARLKPVLGDGVRSWVLPLMPATGKPSSLAGELQAQNIGFWKKSIVELGFTVLARSGVSSLDRRVFISYRRIETEPMAIQLRDALSRKNFSVFLDTVSVDPGVNFQESLFEQLSQMSMVVLLHSKTFSTSKWTMAEADFVRDHDLSLFILRLPEVANDDPLISRYRAGDVLVLQEKQDVLSSGKGGSWRLNKKSLGILVDQIVAEHDREMTARLSGMRLRLHDALDRNGVKWTPRPVGASVCASSDDGKKNYWLFCSSRPPGVPELFDASTYIPVADEKRLVIGHLSSRSKARAQLMDWTIGGRNVDCVDVSMLDTLAKRLKKGDV